MSWSLLGFSFGWGSGPFTETNPDCWCSGTPTSSQSAGIQIGVTTNTMLPGGCDDQIAGDPPVTTCSLKVKRCERTYSFYVISPVGVTHSRDDGGGGGWLPCIGGAHYDDDHPIDTKLWIVCGLSKTHRIEFYGSLADCQAGSNSLGWITYGGVWGDCGTGTAPPGD